MEVKEFTEAEKDALIARYARMSFANLKKNILQDLRTNSNESVLFKKYKKEEIVKFLENPQKYEKEVRELSCFLYMVSSHYRRLVDYYGLILLYNYNVVPSRIPENYDKNKYKESYLKVIRECDKYNLRHEGIKATKIAIRDGVFFGLEYESEDSYFIKPVLPQYAKISGVEDGVYTYEFDLNYFNKNKNLLHMYGKEFINAYDKYKGNPEKGIPADKNKRWFEPSNGVCLKVDESDPYYSLPLFTGLLTEVFSIEDAKMLQKAKKENDNYRALSAQIATDSDGVPLLSFEENQKWFNHICDNVDNAGVGVFMSPFTITDFSFASTKTSDDDDITSAQENFWMSSGTSSLIFGSAKATSSSSLTLSVKPDEQISYAILLQFQRHYNKKLKKKNMDYEFKVEFTQQSIFNNTEYVDRYAKAASSGLPVKTYYATSLGLSPSDVWNMTVLEEDVLCLAKEKWITPLVASSTMSHSENGRPTAEESGDTLGDSGENTRNSDGNDR
jgi:hypothetical protein